VRRRRGSKTRLLIHGGGLVAIVIGYFAMFVLDSVAAGVAVGTALVFVLVLVARRRR
jgi:hypothetical protein